MLPREAVQVVTKCACCRGPAEVQIWGVELCRVCHGAWWTEPQFDQRAIDEAIGARQWHLEQVLTGVDEAERVAERQRYADEATRRTKAWVLGRQKPTARAA